MPAYTLEQLRKNEYRKLARELDHHDTWCPTCQNRRISRCLDGLRLHIIVEGMAEWDEPEPQVRTYKRSN